MPAAAATETDAPANVRTRTPRWIMLSSVLLLCVVLAFAGWWLVRTDALTASEHQRNIHEVDVAARLIESWPLSVRAMAAGSLLPSRVNPVMPADVDLGWPRAARFMHPALGTIYVHYSVAGPDGCPAPEAGMTPPDAKARGYVTFRDARPRMIVAGTIAVADLWYADQLSRLSGDAVRRFDRARDAPALIGSVFAPSDTTAAARLCFKTILPLERVVNIAETAPDLEKLLLIDRSGKLLAQLGGAPLPMANVYELAQLRPAIELDQLLAATENLAGGKTVTVPAKPPDSAETSDRSAPVRVTVGGRNYFAYTRTLILPSSFQATECGESDAAPIAAVQPAAGAPMRGAIAAARTCLVIGLVPTRTVNAAALQLPPAALTGFGLLLALVVALIPVLKLRLIGASDSLRRVEVIAVAVGTIAAVAIATLALLTATALFHDEDAAMARAREVAAAMSADFTREFTAMTALPVQVARLDEPKGSAYMPVEPETYALPCTRSNGTPSTSPPYDTTPGVLIELGNDGRWPLREASLLFGELGAGWPGYRPVYNHCNAGGRTNIAERAYFKAAMNGDSDGYSDRRAAVRPGITFDHHYVVTAVRTLPDGIEKAIVATPFHLRKGAAAGGPQRGALIETMIPRTFVAPVLPAPMHFLVVDARDPALPVMFGSNPYRIDVDRLIDDIPSPRALAAIAEARCPPRTAAGSNDPCTMRITSFIARYEGVPHRFVTHGLAGTPWVLLVYFPDDAVAAPVASAAVLAAGAWSGFAFVVTLILVGAGALWLHQRLWQWAWPSPGGSGRYRVALHRVAIGSGAATLAYMLLLLVPSPAAGTPRLLLALAAVVAIVVATARQLGHAMPPQGSTRRFLDPADERAFRALAIAMLIVVGAAPMIALWCDARLSTFAAADAQHGNAIAASIETNVTARHAVMAAFGTLYDADGPPGDTPMHGTSPVPNAGLYARRAADLHSSPDDNRAWERLSITATMRDWSLGQLPVSALACGPAYVEKPTTKRTIQLAPTLSELAIETFCSDKALTPAAAADTADSAVLRVSGIALLAIGLGTLLIAMLDMVLRGLFGHGVPLEAVIYPGIRRAGDGRLKLPVKALVLNAPLALRLELLESWQLIDLSDPHGAAPAASSRILVTGLALALRDHDLRIKALELLEGLARRVDIANRTATRQSAAATPPSPAEPDDATPAAPAAAQLVVMTDLSPLDRVLQAYETEQALAGADRDQRADEGRREQLRWSRLFESFATISFRPVTKVSPWSPDSIGNAFSDDERRGVATLVNEIRDLPEVVIDSLIDAPEGRIASYWKRHTRTRAYPFDPGLYHALYDRRVRLWARSVRPASSAAAIDYLRGTLIEHYQYAWIASSHAERVILDSLARGRTVNISTSFALRSLVRRGLIRLAPVPQLINRSFAAFVVQAEKPMQIQAWRDEQPRSLWQRTSLPLLTVVPAAVIVLGALAFNSGDSAIGLLPLLLGSAPALIGTLSGLRKTG